MVKQTTKWRVQRLSSNSWDAGMLFVFPSLFFSLRGIQMAGGKIKVCIAQYQTHARNHIYVRWLVSLAGFVWVLYWAVLGFLCFWVCIFFSPAIPSVQHSDSGELLFRDTSNQRQQVVLVRCYSRQRHLWGLECSIQELSGCEEHCFPKPLALAVGPVHVLWGVSPAAYLQAPLWSFLFSLYVLLAVVLELFGAVTQDHLHAEIYSPRELFSKWAGVVCTRKAGFWKLDAAGVAQWRGFC